MRRALTAQRKSVPGALNRQVLQSLRAGGAQAQRLRTALRRSAEARSGAGGAPSQLYHIQQHEQHQGSGRRTGSVFKVLLAGLAGASIGATIINKSNDHEANWTLAWMQSLPLRLGSRLWGNVHNLELPMWMREPMYKGWTWMFDCKLDEMRDPLLSYPNMAAFFTRYLKPGVRPISSAEMISPVDAKITVFGEVRDGDKVDQIKGMSYSLRRLIGEAPRMRDPNNRLYYAVFYLAPGDYHRIHSSADCTLHRRIHFPGDLLSVSPTLLKFTPNAFVLNERIALNGTWKHGYFSMTPVGAYNVGSIKLNLDPEVVTNRSGQIGPKGVEVADPYGKGTAFTKVYPSGGLKVGKGDELARFELGSTVVLVWETDQAEFEFNVQAGQKIRLGESIGRVVSKAAPKPAAEPAPAAPAAVAEAKAAPAKAPAAAAAPAKEEKPAAAQPAAKLKEAAAAPAKPKEKEVAAPAKSTGASSSKS